MVERYRCFGWDIRRGEMRSRAEGEWVLYSDYADLERQIAELRAELVKAEESWAKAATSGIADFNRAEAAEAENARLRALPLKDEVERLTYGQKLIAEAIEHHFGERTEDYDEDADDTTNRDAWEAFDALVSRLRAGEQEGWRTIETAPKDGTRILLHGRVHLPSIDVGEESTVVAYWANINAGGWVWYGALSTVWTHWMPLPAAPSEQGGDRDANR